MKIEIDLDEILGDESGAETLQESVRRQVVESIVANMKLGIGKKIDIEVSKAINDEIKKALAEQMPTIINDLMDKEFQSVNRWGDPEGHMTTFRKALLKSINEEMVYKNTSYSSERNAFTNAVNSLVESKVNDFKKDFNKKVDEGFINDAMTYALNKLKERLKV